MRIELNGEDREVEDSLTVADTVRMTGAAESGRGVAVAVDGEVVPRSEWEAVRLTEGGRVEVVRAVQGG